MDYSYESEPDGVDPTEPQVGPETAVETQVVPDPPREAEEAPETLEELMESETVDKVTIRYVGPNETFKPKGFGKFNAGVDYSMSEKCALSLLRLKNADGTPAFERV